MIDAGQRLHLQHGPIDLIIECSGQHAAVQRAYHKAAVEFDGVLQSLVDELPVLRTGGIFAHHDLPVVNSVVAKRMLAAIKPFSTRWLSPMIAVAGAVADHVLASMRDDLSLKRIMINNGGDIALWLNHDAHCRIGVCTQPESGGFSDTLTLRAHHGIGGVATSGWRGRSHSLGIADAVTVLAKDAATADVAATLLANAVNIADCADIIREPASELCPDSDLLDSLVTTHVGTLTQQQRSDALHAGAQLAARFYQRGLITAAYLHLQGETQVVGLPALSQRASQTTQHLNLSKE